MSHTSSLHDGHGQPCMLITPDDVLTELRSALGKPVEIDPDVPLIESGFRVNSLTMLTILSSLERAAQVEIPQNDLIKLSTFSINGIVAWFQQNQSAAQQEGGVQ